ncbi:MAG TPA: GNAT family N-acetyltransferase [Burkholderiaceae bacterium]|nr:GNAT family N-acetyltransferase [Burkholderiaceae bacterium]
MSFDDAPRSECAFGIRVERVSPALPAVRRLIAQSDAYMAALYPAESNHLESVSALQQPHVAFFGAFAGHQLAGCGAAKILDDDGVYGEIKRLFVDDAHRGRGISLAIMARIERHLAEAGIGIARLETGIHQPEAIALYRRLGYRERAPFGSYRPDPLSLFMEKRLDVSSPPSAAVDRR